MPGGETVAIHRGTRESSRRDIGWQGITDRPGRADDPARQHSAVLAQVGGVEYALHDEVRVRSEHIDRLARAQLEQLRVDSPTGRLLDELIVHAVRVREAVGQRLVHADHDGAYCRVTPIPLE